MSKLKNYVDNIKNIGDIPTPILYDLIKRTIYKIDTLENKINQMQKQINDMENHTHKGFETWEMDEY